jgi:ribonuclease T1
VIPRKSRAAVWLIVAFAVFAGALWQQRADHVQTPAPASTERRAPSVAPTPAAPAKPVPTARPQSRSAAAPDALPASIPEREREELEKTLALIRRGGPFPHKQDGSIFSNRERRLPSRPRGYYREYTVRTPGAQNRGARRVVQGREGETWYTRDHYDSFVRIDE